MATTRVSNDAWPAALEIALAERVDADMPRFSADIWKRMTPIDDVEGAREASNELVAELVAHLAVTTNALEIISTNSLDGGKSADKPTARAAFAMRMLAAVALIRIGRTAPARARRRSRRSDG